MGKEAQMTVEEIEAELLASADPKYAASMARYNLPTDNLLGVRMKVIRGILDRIGTNHELAEQLWKNKWREAWGIGIQIADPNRIGEEFMEEWVARFDNWGTCDGFSGWLFCKTPFAWKKAYEWAERDEEFVKRAAFSIVAGLASGKDEIPDEKFVEFLEVIKAKSDDERNFVWKGVNWALREIGKRNLALNAAAIKTAEEIVEIGTRAGRWVARDALRELRSEKVQKRLKK